MPKPHIPSSAVKRVLRKLGADLREARQRRRLTMAVVAERAFTSRATLQRVEAGDPGVSMGIYASVLQALGLLDRFDQHGHLSIAKFPKESDDYSIETWEEIALRLAERVGIKTPVHELLQVAGKPVLLSRRFDRDNGWRIPFLSAMSMTGSRDGERGSYPELVDALTAHGAQAKEDARQLYRRVVFNVLVSNVDDHLRNHGFLWSGQGGWVLSPACDLNPTPLEIPAIRRFGLRRKPEHFQFYYLGCLR
jgi:transcriptional regulator with XRE-family HTH domain